MSFLGQFLECFTGLSIYRTSKSVVPKPNPRTKNNPRGVKNNPRGRFKNQGCKPKMRFVGNTFRTNSVKCFFVSCTIVILLIEK